MTRTNDKEGLKSEVGVPPVLQGRGRLARVLEKEKKPLGARAAVLLRACWGGRIEGAFGILMYHRIAWRAVGVAAPTWNVTPRRFGDQMRGLLARGYRPWPLRRVLEYRRAGWPIPPRTFVVTFDDGYENTYHFAWPVLKAHRIPATIFLATAYLDGDAPMPCDDWPAAGWPHVPAVSWKPLSTRQCAEMLEQRLVELGTHTHTHADFRDRPDALREDLLISLDVLRERFGLTGATFAFPYGDQGLGFCSPRLTEVARELRLLCSLTTESELVTPERDPFDWGRFPVEATDTATTLAAKLDGSYGRVRKVWRWLDRFPANGCARPAGELRRRHVRQSTESNMPRR